MSNLYADGEDDSGHAIPLETSLDRVSGFIVKQLLEESDPLENQLACKECRLRKFFSNLFAELGRTLHHIGPNVKSVFRRQPKAAGKVHIFLQGFPGRIG